MWQAFLWSSSVCTTVKAQSDKIASLSARVVANIIGVKKPPWMELNQWWETLAQNWPSMDRKGQYEIVDCHQRTYAQLGWSCCQDGPQRNLCEGLEMPRSSMVEMETAPLERCGERQMVWPTPTKVQNLQVGGQGCWGSFQIHCVGICPGQHGLVASCSKSWKLETVFQMWKEPCIDGPGCLGGPMCVRHDWDGCRCYLVDREKKRERKVWRALGTPLFCIKRIVKIALMSSGYRAGYGWPDSYGRGYGRRRGLLE